MGRRVRQMGFDQSKYEGEDNGRQLSADGGARLGRFP